ncbi:hypothetical protein ACV4WX_32320, partial [Pseudomonas aeruginosa]
MSSITEDDKTVWDTPSGYVLTCNKTLCMEETQVQVFTEGKRYRVESMHPIAIPAFVKVIDDQGELHMLGVVRRNPRNFRQPSSSPATSASRSM